MAFQPCIATINHLAADQAVVSSIVPVDITGFTFALGAARRIRWELDALFTLGATGGFRFLANGPAAPNFYNAIFQVVDLTTPTTFNAGQATEADFTNASAVAATYSLRASGNILSAAAGTFAFQFAQNNSTVNAITILEGACIKLFQY